MSWWTPTFKQGVNTVDQFLANEGGWASGSRMRFYQGGQQPIGGWAKHSNDAFTGTARHGISWRTLDGLPTMAFGTTSNLYAEIDGTRFDITPMLHWTVLSDAFSTVDGTNIVTITLPQHRFSAGDAFTLSNPQNDVAGLSIEGDWTVATVPTADTFTFVAGSNANADLALEGGLCDITAPLPASYETWSLDPWGENLLANPSGYGLFEFQPETAYTELAFNGDFNGNADGWALGTGWSYSSNAVVATDGTASNLSQNVEGVLEPGRTYRIRFASSGGAGTLKFRVNVAVTDDPTPLPVTISIDTPAVFSCATPLSAGQAVKLATTGSLPSPLLADTTYYVISAGLTDSEFQLSATAGGSAINTTGTQFGTHSVILAGVNNAVIDVGTASAPITTGGNYDRLFLCPADVLDIVFEKDADYIGGIDSVSYQLYDKAYRVYTAPARIDSMFVDPAGLVVALGTTDSDQGSYSATLYRCSDLGNNKNWVADTNSLASEQQLRSIGGRLLQGTNTSEQNIVLGDAGALSLQYQGIAGKAFNPVLLGTGCGGISRHCMVAVNGIVFWLGNAKQAFILQGVSNQSLGKPLPIRCTLANELFDNIDQASVSKIHAGLNLAFQEAWFSYPDARDATGECSRIASVAWTETDQDGQVPWIIHELARSAWIASGTYANPIGFGEDSGSNYIYDHETGTTADGAALDWLIRSASFDVQDGQFLATIDELISQFSSQSGDVAVSIFYRDSPRDDWTEADLGLVTETTNFLYPEIKSREFAIQFSEGSTGAFFRLAPGNLRLDITPTQATH